MIKFIICFSISLNSCFAQDTISLSQTLFKINSCEIDSVGFIFLKEVQLQENNKNYILTYIEYRSPRASAHYASCRSKTLATFLKTTYSINITEIKFETITTRKKVKIISNKEIPIGQEIFLISK